MSDFLETRIPLDAVGSAIAGTDRSGLWVEENPSARRAEGRGRRFGTMRLTAAIVIVALLGIVLALLFVGVRGPASPAVADAPSGSRSLGASRFMMLLPDGRVEFADAWTRRVFRWDGRRWVELERREPTATRARGR